MEWSTLHIQHAIACDDAQILSSLTDHRTWKSVRRLVISRPALDRTSLTQYGLLFFPRLTPSRHPLGLFLFASLLCRSSLFIVGRPGRQHVRHIDDTLADGRFGKVLVEIGSGFISTALSRPARYRSSEHQQKRPDLVLTAQTCQKWKARDTTP